MASDAEDQTTAQTDRSSGISSVATLFTVISLEEAAATPRWSDADTRALQLNCRSAMLDRWGVNLARRFGAAAPDEVREILSLSDTDLPNSPDKTSWMPVWMHLRVSEVVLDRFVDGDIRLLASHLDEDLQRDTGRVARAGLRAIGPGALFRHASKLHPEAYNSGSTHCTVRRGHASVSTNGDVAFTNPTFCMLQMLLHEATVRLCGRAVRECSARVSAAETVVETFW